jgi:hypothetical protein
MVGPVKDSSAIDTCIDMLDKLEPNADTSTSKRELAAVTLPGHLTRLLEVLDPATPAEEPGQFCRARRCCIIYLTHLIC